MPLSDLTTSAQNYLKVLWSLREWSDEPVSASLLATKTGLKLSTVSGAITKLADQGLVDHTPYGAVALTAAGEELALGMVRRHRLLETFLVTVLGYGWDEVHDEAENLEHAVSDELIARIDRYLDHPDRDPHGDPIPSATGEVDRPDARCLTTVAPGVKVVVERIADDDPEMLRFFAQRGVVVGAHLEIAPGAPFSESLDVRVGDAAAVPLGRAATDAVWVSV